MIKLLIIEDEIPARKKLKRFIEELSLPVEIMAEIDTVKAGIIFLTEQSPDLIISDIELLDGNVFDVLSKVKIKCPIIFTTAYDHFWMNAFETNGIAYLLKPFSREKFQMAWEKFSQLRPAQQPLELYLGNLEKLIGNHLVQPKYKTRFAIHKSHEVYFIEVETIVYFEASEGVVFAFDKTGKKHILSESTLKEIEDQLNPVDFFRINRSELVHKPFVEKIERFKKNTIALKLKGFDKYLETSQASTADFRKWIEQ